MREVLGEELYEKNLVFIQGALSGKSQFFERAIKISEEETAFVNAMYIPDMKNGKVLGFYVLVTDISELKKVQKEKEDMYQLLIQSSKMMALGEMASGIAHEINNPLSIINMNANIALELIEENNLDVGKLQKVLFTINSTSARIAKIITGLQFFSQERMDDAFESVSVAEIVSETTSFCLEKFKSRKISFLQSTIDPKIKIECFPTQISQVLLNLLNNGADAVEGRENKWVSLNVKNNVDSVEISISDSGPGVDPFVAQRIMQPFVTTKEPGKGTGLGLSISKGIVEKHGGKLWLNTQVLNTTFVIHLPKTQK